MCVHVFVHNIHIHTHTHTHTDRDVDTSGFAGGGVDLVGEIWKSISDLQSKENFIQRDAQLERCQYPSVHKLGNCMISRSAQAGKCTNVHKD